ncbi:hypothetical protein LZG04_34915 [Saccharothrix sp. S26]|uniref:hypothetical protein n=1 Tax=Saccharothrix sp. S26 TaxID=2907215 RepID=UPI001F2A3570|nr:hypothetical protein [Saccharothrix sp. S26]MCE6999970.1 hypothetical protein [Saccharothrix sp. S26]
MDPTTLVAAARRFPLLGRPRPTCPSLVRRVQEVADIAHKAGQAGTDGLAEGAHALNKAALIASDCGVPSLARDLCWQHIDLYRVAADRPLTVLQARYMLEPVLNLARLQIRASDGEQALHLLTAMHRAVMSKADLDVDGQTLPLTDLTGTRQEHHKLREWVWLHLVGDGIRALTLAGRWDDAVAHAQAHRGVGLHLMEGRQATIVAHCLKGAGAEANAALAESRPVQPWELQVSSCLKVMCSDAAGVPARRDIYTMIGHFLGQEPMPGYAAFRAQLGLTVTTLASATDPEAADAVLTQVSDEVIKAGDGYAARDVLRYRDTQANLTNEQREALSDLLVSSGLGAGALPETLLMFLLGSTQAAAKVVRMSLPQQKRPAM